jgi:hypothetical protein
MVSALDEHSRVFKCANPRCGKIFQGDLRNARERSRQSRMQDSDRDPKPQAEGDPFEQRKPEEWFSADKWF